MGGGGGGGGAKSYEGEKARTSIHHSILSAVVDCILLLERRNTTVCRVGCMDLKKSKVPYCREGKQVTCM